MVQNLLRGVLFLTGGLVIGIGIGLFVGWVAWPIEYSDANPSILQQSYQEDYVQMIADVYDAEMDLNTATMRLLDLGEDYPQLVLNTINNRLLQDAETEQLLRLAVLASDLNLSSPAITSILAMEPDP